MVEASVTGLFRTVLIIIGVFVLLRYVGQWMNVKRNNDEEQRLSNQRAQAKKEREHKQKNLGKTNILKKNSSSTDVEDVDFEELAD
jgi:uncharacterized membrane protein YhiD involved in acid resistance